MRLVRIAGADLSLFEFDFDLTWYGFFLSADEVVYGRYGGRDAKSDEGRLSLAGLKYAMQKALARHAMGGARAADRGAPIRAEDYKAAKLRRANECIHCHQVNEFRRADAKAAGKWSRDDLWVYPLPENIGLTMEVDHGDVVQSVAPASPAARAGLAAGDTLILLNDKSVASFADAQYALHKAPKAGPIPVEWARGNEVRKGQLEVVDGWRKTNITWRSSLLDILPSLPISGEDLTSEEKKSLGLSESRAAIRQDKFVHSTLRAVGLRSGDVIVGMNGKSTEGTMDDFLAIVRREHLVGDPATLNVLRDGKPVDIKLILK